MTLETNGFMLAKSAVQEFDDALRDLSRVRANDYGYPTINFARIAKLFEVVQECPDPLVRHALQMICVKVARLIKSPEHTDSWIDIAGYARTGVMLYSPKEPTK